MTYNVLGDTNNQRGDTNKGCQQQQKHCHDHQQQVSWHKWQIIQRKQTLTVPPWWENQPPSAQNKPVTQRDPTTVRTVNLTSQSAETVNRHSLQHMRVRRCVLERTKVSGRQWSLDTLAHKMERAWSQVKLNLYILLNSAHCRPAKQSLTRSKTKLPLLPVGLWSWNLPHYSMGRPYLYWLFVCELKVKEPQTAVTYAAFYTALFQSYQTEHA